MKLDHIKTETKHLCTIVSKIDNPEDAFAFLRDLLTHNELKEFSQRLQIAKLLIQKVSYKEIEKQTWTSSTTIARVSKFLNWDLGGYRKRIPQN